MSFVLHPDFRLQRLTIGRELAPLIVIDDLMANAEQLVDLAAAKQFGDNASHFPGIRAKAPLTYQQFILDHLRAPLADYFGLKAGALRFTACHFSVVTVQPANLDYLQRIPHIDSLAGNELAFIHYLFKSQLGGTAFYRHRQTGFEYLDQTRRTEYWRFVEAAKSSPESPPAEYIDGDTSLYERVGKQDGVFNRMLVYRRNSLHSGVIGPDFVGNPNPRAGRLSVNGFLT